MLFGDNLMINHSNLFGDLLQTETLEVSYSAQCVYPLIQVVELLML